jgi:hypothetical protein
MLMTRAAAAQAFVPPAGEGSITIAYQNLLAHGHLDLNGDRMPGASGTDRVHTHAAVLEAEVGVTARWALNVALPYIRSRYDGDAPHRPQGTGAPREWDDGTYHQTFQDFRFGVRYNITTHPLAITPFAEAIIPSHHYPSIAHAAVGKDLRALVVGGAAGGFLDAISPRLFFQVQAAYAVVQDVVDIRPNRSRVDGEVGYFITPRLAVRFLESYQVTHHGLDVLAFSPMIAVEVHDHAETAITSEHRVNHDRLQRANYFTLGGGFGFALNDSMQVFGNVVTVVWGENVHPLRGITVGLNTQFRTPWAANSRPPARDSRRE